MVKNIHEIKLTGKDEFTKKFNEVSDLFQKSMDETLTEKEQNEARELYVHKKTALEMGY